MTEKLKPCKECATHRALMREAAEAISALYIACLDYAAIGGRPLSDNFHTRMNDKIARLTAAAEGEDK